MKNFDLHINMETKEISYQYDDGFAIHDIVVGLETLIEDIANRNDLDVEDAKLDFFMLVTAHFAGKKTFYLNHIIVRIYKKYRKIKEWFYWNI